MTWLCILAPVICFAFAGILAAMDSEQSTGFLLVGTLLFYVSIVVLSCS